jgi:hypothetical protein
MIDISCACGKTYRVQQGPVEKRAKCKNCGALLTIAKAALENSADMDGELPWVQAATGAPAPTKKCPACAELVKAEAVKCKHCGSALLSDRQVKKLKKGIRDLLVLAYLMWFGGVAFLLFWFFSFGPSRNASANMWFWLPVGPAVVCSIIGGSIVYGVRQSRKA